MARPITELATAATLLTAGTLFQILRKFCQPDVLAAITSAQDIVDEIEPDENWGPDVNLHRQRITDHLQDYYDVRVRPTPGASITRTCDPAVAQAIEEAIGQPEQIVRNLLNLIRQGIVSNRATSVLPASSQAASSTASQALDYIV